MKREEKKTTNIHVRRFSTSYLSPRAPLLLSTTCYTQLDKHNMDYLCDDSLIEEVFALMELRFLVFLHITNRAVYMESTRLYIQDKGEGEKRIESINNAK